MTHSISGAEQITYFSPIPWESLFFFDIEAPFLYMLRSWKDQLELLPIIFGPQLPLPDLSAPTEPPSQEDPSCCLDNDCCYLQRVCSTLTLRHIEPGGIGYSHGYTTIEGLFFPLSNQGKRWPFIDLRVHYFNNNQWAGNLGLGVRFLSCETAVYGVNTYFDFRKWKHHNPFFAQIGFGLERLGPCWDFRLNGYFPIKRDKTEKRCHFTYPGGFFIDMTQHRVANTGFDMEIGRHLFCGDCIRLYSAIGPYYYGKTGGTKAFVGGRLRLFVDISRYLTFEGILTYDSHYKTRVQGGIAIHFPFGCCPEDNCCQDLLSQPIRRNEIIPLQKYCKWCGNF
ncbi:MAG: inverse autotransporter beta domain-containing protein [Verrucomicrobia bacterium]|nr:inverse autotransporter beta domain-containing protein [Verrucomicrobiota bacterium]